MTHSSRASRPLLWGFQKEASAHGFACLRACASNFALKPSRREILPTCLDVPSESTMQHACRQACAALWPGRGQRPQTNVTNRASGKAQPRRPIGDEYPGSSLDLSPVQQFLHCVQRHHVPATLVYGRGTRHYGFLSAASPLALMQRPSARRSSAGQSGTNIPAAALTSLPCNSFYTVSSGITSQRPSCTGGERVTTANQCCSTARPHAIVNVPQYGAHPPALFYRTFRRLQLPSLQPIRVHGSAGRRARVSLQLPMNRPAESKGE